MKINQALPMLAVLILALAPVTGHSQAYFYSGPVAGWFEANLTPDGYGGGGFGVAINSITEILYYDPASLALRIVGSASVSPDSGTFNMGSSMHYTTSDFGSATLVIGNNGSFSFDMTAYRISLASSRFDAMLLVPISGSGIYNGQPFAGSWNLRIGIDQITISDVSPSLLTFSENTFRGDTGKYVIPGTNLSTGISDGTYHYTWSQDPVVATAVPEPNAIALLGLGLASLAFLRHRPSMSCS